MRKIVLEAVSGAQTRDNNQLTQLAEILGARRQFLSDMARERILIEENQVLAQLIDRIGRKSPEGEHVISKEWKMRAIQFYEQVSDIIKGHHSIYKVGMAKHWSEQSVCAAVGLHLLNVVATISLLANKCSRFYLTLVQLNQTCANGR